MTYRSAGAATILGYRESDGLTPTDTLHKAVADSVVVLGRLIHGSSYERYADDNHTALLAMDERTAYAYFPSGGCKDRACVISGEDTDVLLAD